MHFLIDNTNLITKVVIGIFIFSFASQLCYYLFIYSKAAKKQPDINPRIRKYPPVSVIICAKNEAHNLKVNLPLFLEQRYPDYEVIVVNDCSEDETADLLDEFSKKYRNLKICTIKKDPKFSHGKKLALTIGIKASENEILLLSDADCKPAGNMWIRYLARNYNEKTEVVLGVGLYEKRKGLLNLLIRVETAFIAMQYISLARSGCPYMGVGRNLSYKKSLFFLNRGFASHLRLESGDDDLFINEVSKSSNTLIENHPASFTYSEPEKKFREWVRQKRRHLTTGKFYQQFIKRILGFEYLTKMLLLLSFIFLLVQYDHTEYVLGVYILSLFIKGIIYIIVFNRFHEKFIFLPAILIEELIPFFYGFLHFINYIERKRSRWQ